MVELERAIASEPARAKRVCFGTNISQKGYGVPIREWGFLDGRLKPHGPLTPADLPVDSHELIALCAPRPVFISAGSPAVEGGWVDARGMFMAAVAAGSVYQLLGKRGLKTGEFPPMETAFIDGDVAFRQHSGGHTTGPNWPTFLTFASRYLKGPARR